MPTGLLKWEADNTALFTKSQLIQEELIHFERGVLQELQQQECTSDEVLRKLENELDLEEARLELDKGLF